MYSPRIRNKVKMIFCKLKEKFLFYIRIPPILKSFLILPYIKVITEKIFGKSRVLWKICVIVALEIIPC